MKSPTRWTSCEDPQPASPPCCLKYAASGLWSTCQTSWPNLTRQIERSAHNSWQTACPLQIRLSETTHYRTPSSRWLIWKHEDGAGKEAQRCEKLLQKDQKFNSYFIQGQLFSLKSHGSEWFQRIWLKSTFWVLHCATVSKLYKNPVTF